MDQSPRVASLLPVCRLCQLGPPAIAEPLYEPCACPSVCHLTCVLRFAQNAESHVCPICRNPFRYVRVRRINGGCGNWLREDPIGRMMLLRYPTIICTFYLLTLIGHLQRVSAHNRTSPAMRHLLKYWVYLFVYLSVICTLFGMIMILERYLSWRRHHQTVVTYTVGVQMTPNSADAPGGAGGAAVIVTGNGGGSGGPTQSQTTGPVSLPIGSSTPVANVSSASRYGALGSPMVGATALT